MIPTHHTTFLKSMAKAQLPPLTGSSSSDAFSKRSLLNLLALNTLFGLNRFRFLWLFNTNFGILLLLPIPLLNCLMKIGKLMIVLSSIGFLTISMNHVIQVSFFSQQTCVCGSLSKGFIVMTITSLVCLNFTNNCLLSTQGTNLLLNILLFELYWMNLIYASWLSWMP